MNHILSLGIRFEYVMFWTIIVIIPIVLIIGNISSFIFCIKGKQEKKVTKYIEIVGLIYGYIGTTFTLSLFLNVTSAHWWQEIHRLVVYPPIAKEYTLTFLTLYILGIIGYGILRFWPLQKQPPLITVCSISFMYITMLLSLVFCIQTQGVHWDKGSILLIIYPINIIILFTKLIIKVVREKAEQLANQVIEEKLEETLKEKGILFLEEYLQKAEDYPKFAFLMMLPILVIVVMILSLFGQKPDSLVAMWTETAEWNLSKRIPPPRLEYDGHYLCTVAACGSPTLVKPLWIGERRGQKILVNRQLAVANAFEQILEEKVPKLHRVIRETYDRIGYPISRHITSKLGSNITYLFMKPLEWVFVFVLYIVDVKPEMRIYRQYRI